MQSFLCRLLQEYYCTFNVCRFHAFAGQLTTPAAMLTAPKDCTYTINRPAIMSATPESGLPVIKIEELLHRLKSEHTKKDPPRAVIV